MLYLLLMVFLTAIMANLSEPVRFIEESFIRSLTAATRAFQTGSAFTFELPAFRISAFGLFFFIVPLIFLIMLDLGYLYYARGTIKDETLGYRSLFEGFNFFFKGLAIRFLTILLVAGGSVFFLLPGLWALCAFSQATLLLLDNPDRGVFWCMRESLRLMRGHKMEYLVLFLSFLGWLLFASLPYIGPVVQLWYMPYSTFTYVGYYNKLTGQGPAEEAQWKRPGMF